ncbi:MAG TPA: hypothetical protein V6C76_11945 [Drouetiella sp.]
MNRLLVLLPVLGAILTTQSAYANKQPNATSSSPSQKCVALPWQARKAQWDVGQELPKFVERAKVISALRPASPPFDPSKSSKEEKTFNDGDAILGIGVKPWIYVPGTFIVVMETEKREPNSSGGYNSCEHALDIGLIKQTNDGFTVLAKTEKPIKLEKRFRFNQFDLSPYKLSEKELAFGLQEASFAGVSGPTESIAMLDLYRNNNSKIEKVLSTPIIYEQQPANHVETARVSVSPEKTDGYYNLAKTYKGKRCYFIWQKDKYSLNGQDTFANYVKGQGVDL